MLIYPKQALPDELPLDIPLFVRTQIQQVACQRWSIPLRREAGRLSCSSRSATSFVWFLPPGRKPEARLATVFAFWYGMDIDE